MALNNFGPLRLAFSFLVIISHAPELHDGNRSREILSNLIDISFGELAVIGFFLVSGYLIVKSFVESSSTRSYLLKRVLRIYPAFIACYILCIFVVAPLAGGSMSYLFGVGALKEIAKIALLETPFVPGTFADLPQPAINGAIWTIAYEFRCYLLVILLGYSGVLRRPMAYLAITAAFLFASAINLPHELPFGEYLIGLPFASARFTAAFLVGGAYFLFGNRIKYSAASGLVAVALLVALLAVKAPTILAIITVGSYIVLWFALYVPAGRLSAFTETTDISYGVYLYAWPVQNLVYFVIPSMGVLVGGSIAAAAAGCLGFLSWHLLERKCKPPRPLTVGYTAGMPARIARGL